jgi:putative transposase
VSRSGYYEWQSRLDSPRSQENALLLTQIRQIHEESRGTYGSPRVHAELTLGLGLPVNLKRIARLMREAGIQGLYRRRRHGCTVRGPAAQPSADLVNRQFTVDAPNRLWITDITEHPTAEGKVYCAAVMDAHSRLVVGWSIAEHMRTELVTDALGMAWPSSADNPRNASPTSRRYYTPTTAPNIRPGRSGNGCAPPACSPPWEPSATPC